MNNGGTDEKTALMKIEEALKAGAMIFFNVSASIPTVDLYTADVTVMTIGIRNSHKIGGGNKTSYMPKKEVIDRIAEANGIVFVDGYTRRETLEDSVCGKRTVYIGFAQGKKRLPDGSWRTSNVANYDFDPTLRTMLDFDVTELTPQTRQKQKIYNGKPSGPTLAKAILECEKFATQRASTGARLNVIRELAGIPTTFSEADIEKPIAFTRIIQNTRYILQTPEGRTMATMQALGYSPSSLFGGGKAALSEAESAMPATGEHKITGGEYTDVTPGPETPPEDWGQPGGGTEAEFEAPPNRTASEFNILTQTLADYLSAYEADLDVNTTSGANPYKSAETELKNPDATVETRKDMLARLKNFLIAKGVRV